jgi:transcription initiation factor TFIIF subunit beta
MARIPRNQLLDLLFAFFREQPYWRLQDLRQRTQQPEAYLKEVLSDIATLNRAGEHASMWELKPNFVEADAKGEAGQAAAGLYQMPYTKAEDYNAEDDDEEEEEEDDDMEEVT